MEKLFPLTFGIGLLLSTFAGFLIAELIQWIIILIHKKNNKSKK